MSFIIPCTNRSRPTRLVLSTARRYKSAVDRHSKTLSSVISLCTALAVSCLSMGCGGGAPSHSTAPAEHGGSVNGGGRVRFETYDQGSAGAPETVYDGDYADDEQAYDVAEVESAPTARTRAAAPSVDFSDDTVDGALATPNGQSLGAQNAQTPPPQDTQEGQAAEPKDRMVYYSGQARLRVTKPTDMVERAIAIVRDNNGFVEQRSDTHVTLRVPVAGFEAIFDRLLKLGDIDDHSVSAQDITDRYTAIELRLRVLTASRDRFMELLKKAKTEQEKLSLLEQIKRLTEQIDSLQIESNTLKSLADYSRIHLQFVPRSQLASGTVHEPVKAFRWIYQLSPFGATAISEEQDYLEFVTPKGFVLFDEDDERWRAESANGAVIWTYARDNEPLGDSRFWIDTIDHRISKSYDSATREKIGQFEVLQLVDGSRQSYRFWIGVRAVEDDLHIVHVYFPSEDHQKRFEDAVRAAFNAAKGDY